MKRKKRFYSKEFKEKAVSLSYQRDNLKELANELGINVERIYKWRSSTNNISAKVSRASSADFSGDVEIKSLKKQLKEKELELEILKKALHIFSKSDGKSISL